MDGLVAGLAAFLPDHNRNGFLLQRAHAYGSPGRWSFRCFIFICVLMSPLSDRTFELSASAIKSTARDLENIMLIWKKQHSNKSRTFETSRG